MRLATGPAKLCLGVLLFLAFLEGLLSYGASARCAVDCSPGSGGRGAQNVVAQGERSSGCSLDFKAGAVASSATTLMSRMNII